MDHYRVWDRNRERCPLTRDRRLGWVVTRHADITRASQDHASFSNQVSVHRSVPNGMDPPEHTPYRNMIEPYFDRERMAAFAPVCRAIAADLVRDAVATDSAIEVQASLGFPFATRVQCRFLGWPASMEQALHHWATVNVRAIRDLDRAALAENARRFEDLIKGQLQVRRDTLAGPDTDLTTRLMHERVHGRGLRDEEIVSILRNWTAGEVGTISASVGILAHFLATHADLQATLRYEPVRIPYAIEEILRIQGPLLTNRRKTTCPVQFGETCIPANQPVTIHWPSGNRDPRIFHDPLIFRWDRNLNDSLLYGSGIHACPGAPLARHGLHVLVEALLDGSQHLAPVREQPPIPADFPLGGYARVWITTHGAPR